MLLKKDRTLLEEIYYYPLFAAMLQKIETEIAQKQHEKTCTATGGPKKSNHTGNEIDELILSCALHMESLETLYRLFRDKVFAFCYSILCDRYLAEDCVQETFTRLPAAAATYQKKGSGSAYILQISKYCAYEMNRKRNKSPVVSSLQWETHVNTAAGRADEVESAITMEKIMQLLTPQQRQVLTLHIYNDLTFYEIARLTGSPQSTVKSRYKRAISRLRDWMEESGMYNETEQATTV